METHVHMANKQFCGTIIATCGCLLVGALSGFAQDEAEDLAKKLANPVAALISVPIQANYDENIGPDELDRRGPREHGVPSLPDLTHAAGTEPAHHLVAATEILADEQSLLTGTEPLGRRLRTLGQSRGFGRQLPVTIVGTILRHDVTCFLEEV